MGGTGRVMQQRAVFPARGPGGGARERWASGRQGRRGEVVASVRMRAVILNSGH